MAHGKQLMDNESAKKDKNSKCINPEGRHPNFIPVKDLLMRIKQKSNFEYLPK